MDFSDMGIKSKLAQITVTCLLITKHYFLTAKKKRKKQKQNSSDTR
jgi:preprotein translocase subunit YajC